MLELRIRINEERRSDQIMLAGDDTGIVDRLSNFVVYGCLTGISWYQDARWNPNARKQRHKTKCIGMQPNLCEWPNVWGIQAIIRVQKLPWKPGGWDRFSPDRDVVVDGRS
jgi:hypothetical protein